MDVSSTNNTVKNELVAEPRDFSALIDQPFEEVVRGPFVFGTRGRLDDEVYNQLVRMFRSEGVRAPRGVLGGRSGSRGVELEGLGRVFVKRYAHGGLLRALTGERFLCIGPCRSQQEFLMLEYVRSFGIGVPRPLMFVKRGALMYATWLVMEELEGTKTLVEVSEQSEEGVNYSIETVMKQLGAQLFVLIKNRIQHIDFHPGNVLVGNDGRVSIVDFDKARITRENPYRLRDFYLRRWRRAVIKHGLSPVLTELLSAELRSYNEGE